MAVKIDDIYKLAEKIKDEKLRKKTISYFKNPKLSNPHFKVKKSKFDEAPSSLNWHHAYEGGLLEHTISITKMSIKIANVLKKIYGIEINFDVLIAGCLLHDASKVFEYHKQKDGWVSSELLLDHTMLGTSELYARGFPQEVIHMVASHFGEKGPTPPMTIEAKILSTVDLFDAEFEADRSEEESINLLDMINEIRD